jgi:hypothetical protein
VITPGDGAHVTRAEVKRVAAQLNNPSLLRAIERFSSRELSWEQAMNWAVVEMARQNDYFLNRLITPASLAAQQAPSGRPDAAQRKAAG